MFKCTQCNYETTRKLNFTRHKLSKKHLKNTNQNIDKLTIVKKSEIVDNIVTKSLKRHLFISQNNENTERLFSLGCNPGSYGTLEIKLLIINRDKSIIKTENYLLIYIYNIINLQKTYSIKISQINSLTTDICDNIDTNFIKNFSTKCSYKVNTTFDNLIIDIYYEYQLNSIDETSISLDLIVDSTSTDNVKLE